MSEQVYGQQGRLHHRNLRHQTGPEARTALEDPQDLWRVATGMHSHPLAPELDKI